MAVTIYDVAKEAGVSIGTVSKALNDSYTIPDQTKEMIATVIMADGVVDEKEEFLFATLVEKLNIPMS